MTYSYLEYRIVDKFDQWWIEDIGDETFDDEEQAKEEVERMNKDYPALGPFSIEVRDVSEWRK